MSGSRSCNKPTRRHAIGCESADPGESRKTKAEDAANFINKAHVCEVHQTYERIQKKKMVFQKKVSRTESLLSYGEASKSDCFFGNKARRI